MPAIHRRPAPARLRTEAPHGQRSSLWLTQEECQSLIPPRPRKGDSLKVPASLARRICLYGLWRWQPAREDAGLVPAEGWGYFKVPGFWPGKTSYIQEDCQTLHAHPKWRDADLRGTTAAWYQRELTVPGGWAGRRIAVSMEYLNSFAVVYIDGEKVGEARFPAGEIDVTAACRPGGKHVLSLLVTAMPLKGGLLSYTDSNSAKEVKGNV